MIKFFLALMIILLSACVGSPKPQELPAGHYVGSTSPSVYNSAESENIEMMYKTDASKPFTVNGTVVIYDANKDTEILTINVINQGTWHTIINGQNGMNNPCFEGTVVTTGSNKNITAGWKAAIVNCWLQENFIPGSWTFQGQLLIWNPVSTINYAQFGTSIFLHTQS